MASPTETGQDARDTGLVEVAEGVTPEVKLAVAQAVLSEGSIEVSEVLRDRREEVLALVQRVLASADIEGIFSTSKKDELDAVSVELEGEIASEKEVPDDKEQSSEQECLGEFEITSISEEQTTNWTVEIDGKITEVGLLKLQSKWGEVIYGWRPEGFDGWAFNSPKEGGAVTLPYFITPKGEVYIGLLLENRPNMGGPRWCITGGFIEAKETPEIAQAREAEEESGLNTLSAVKSPFFSFIQDRLFFVGNPTKGEGVKVYFFEVPYSEVSKTIDVESIYKIKDGMMSSKMQKRSEALHFFEWTEAVGKTGDGIALAAIAQFIAYLNKKTEDTL